MDADPSGGGARLLRRAPAGSVPVLIAIDEPDHRRQDPSSEDAERGDRLQGAADVARLAGGAWLRGALWSAEVTLRAADASWRAARSLGESAAPPSREAARIAGGTGQEIASGAVRALEAGTRRAAAGPGRERVKDDASPSLRERGARLLERSTELAPEAEPHPGFASILAQLAPDEARILRLLALEGPQPAVDIRATSPLGLGSRTVAPGISMIGRHAGCLRREQVPAYLSNLFRLGLIWFSGEPLKGTGRYDVLEAQPAVQEALREAGRGRTKRRSIQLTPFGEQFCRHCLPLDAG